MLEFQVREGVVGEIAKVISTSLNASSTCILDARPLPLSQIVSFDTVVNSPDPSTSIWS